MAKDQPPKPLKMFLVTYHPAPAGYQRVPKTNIRTVNLDILNDQNAMKALHPYLVAAPPDATKLLEDIQVCPVEPGEGWFKILCTAVLLALGFHVAMTVPGLLIVWIANYTRG